MNTHQSMKVDILELATKICSAEHRAKYGMHLEKRFQQNPGEVRDSGPTTAPDADEIIETAKKLYYFVRFHGE